MTDLEFEIYGSDPEGLEEFLGPPPEGVTPSNVDLIRKGLGSSMMTQQSLRPRASLVNEFKAVTNSTDAQATEYLRGEGGVALQQKSVQRIKMEPMSISVKRTPASPTQKNAALGDAIEPEAVTPTQTGPSAYDIAANIASGIGNFADILAQNKNEERSAAYAVEDAMRRAEDIMRAHDFQRAENIHEVADTGLASSAESYEDGTGVARILESNRNTAVREGRELIDQARRRQEEVRRRSRKRKIGGIIGGAIGATAGYFAGGGPAGAAVGFGAGTRLGGSGV